MGYGRWESAKTKQIYVQGQNLRLWSNAQVIMINQADGQVMRIGGRKLRKSHSPGTIVF